jgi:hypothetical protein
MPCRRSIAGTEFPGFEGLGLTQPSPVRDWRTPQLEMNEEEPYIFHFDGNALARHWSGAPPGRCPGRPWKTR